MAFNSKYKSSKIEELLDKIVKLAKVAISGSYDDLDNKPTIPTAVTESTVSGWGFTKNTGTYSKPSGGIPKSDLASSVQTSLGKADTALQSYTEQYKGTVTGVKVNGSTKNPSNGVVDLGTVITSHQDISGKQDKLVSGTNIKTINGQSIVGSGNITISGGGGEQIEEPFVYDTGEQKLIMFENATVLGTPINTPMMPNVTYVCTEPVDGVTLYNIQLPTGNIGKYTLHFEIGAEGGYLDVNSEFPCYYPNGEVNKNLEPFGTYELSIVATKLVYNGESLWLYKVVLTSFKSY